MSHTAQLLSTRQVAEILGTSTATVKRLALAGDLPHAAKAPGDTGAYLFDRSVVELVRQSRLAAERAS